MPVEWQPYREPLRATVLRTGVIAIVAGAVASRFLGGWASWPVATILALWPAFGGHWVELWFLNWLRPRIPGARGWQVAARIAVWFAGGTVLAAGMVLTAMALGRFRRLPAWWAGGGVFIGIELAVHLAMHLRGRGSFYDGRG